MGASETSGRSFKEAKRWFRYGDQPAVPVMAIHSGRHDLRQIGKTIGVEWRDMLLDGVLYYPHEDGVEIRGGKSKESPVLVTVNPDAIRMQECVTNEVWQFLFFKWQQPRRFLVASNKQGKVNIKDAKAYLAAFGLILVGIGDRLGAPYAVDGWTERSIASDAPLLFCVKLDPKLKNDADFNQTLLYLIILLAVFITYTIVRGSVPVALPLLFG